MGSTPLRFALGGRICSARNPVLFFFSLMRWVLGLQEADREELHELEKVMHPSLAEMAFTFLL